VTESDDKPANVAQGGTEAQDVGSRAMSSDQARQGVVSGRVVTVLAVSVILALLGLVLAFVFA
jgi:hypothetical protein